jgi:FtsP/CotA-like multicopper oxidase with cupredoxin domain
MFNQIRLAASAVLLVGTATLAAAAPPSLQPAGWDRDLKLREAVDRNPDPHIVEIDLDARIAAVEVAPGVRADAWTYDGGIPGPLIRAHAGDRLIVHFTNHLPKPTTVHWHGIRVPIQMDGVPDVSQPEVQTGGTFTYDFIVPDAGLFWYHPHVMSAAQVGYGLYGALLVDDPAEQVGVADEAVIVLSDIGIDAHGMLDSPDSGGSTGMAFGREGGYVLVNGKVNPRLVARSGAPQRWRIVNTAKSRFFQIDLDGQKFTRIGGDGGLLEHPVVVDTLVLAPGERADVIVTPKLKPGSELQILSFPFNRGYGSVEYRAAEQLITLAIDTAPPYEGPPVPQTHRTIAPISTAGATPVDIEFTLAQRPDGTFEYGINGSPFAARHPISAKPGETQVWTIVNKTKWSHPFHLHGFFFQVLDENGQHVTPLEWKDTVNVPLEQTLKLVVRYDEDRPGSWMYHCHILDHADGGLMGMVDVGVPHVDHSGHSH